MRLSSLFQEMRMDGKQGVSHFKVLGFEAFKFVSSLRTACKQGVSHAAFKFVSGYEAGL